MARLLVDTLAGDYDPSEYEDDYQGAVEALVKAKLEGGEVKTKPETKEPTGEVVDLLAALQRSVDAAKTSRGESSDGDSAEAEADEKSAAKTSATQKSTAKKSAAKSAGSKAPAKKKSASKTTKKTATKKTAAKKKAS